MSKEYIIKQIQDFLRFNKYVLSYNGKNTFGLYNVHQITGRHKKEVSLTSSVNHKIINKHFHKQYKTFKKLMIEQINIQQYTIRKSHSKLYEYTIHMINDNLELLVLEPTFYIRGSYESGISIDFSLHLYYPLNTEYTLKKEYSERLHLNLVI